MSFTDMFMILPSAALSAVFWLIVLAVLLYIARVPAHRAILSVSRVMHYAFRLTANSVKRAEHRLIQRNREVLLAAGRETAERIIEREFERVDDTVRRDLAEYPALHRELSETVSKLEEDHEKSGHVPPSPPGWVNAVEAVARIPAQGDAMVGKVLDSIHKSMVDAQAAATDEYRKASSDRHQALTKMMPEWRKMTQVLGTVDRSVKSLLERSKVIDRRMDDYDHIVRGTDRAERMLSSSSMIQFVISIFVLAIAVGGAMINFNLIARPMSEMVGGHNMIGGFKVADIAALVIIMLEITTGLFLMESLRITGLFPMIAALPDKTRIWMIRFSFGFLFSLASIEAGLAYMREILLQDELATSALLRGEGGAAFDNTFVWITTGAQMGMGFVLPFILTFVAIPLEYFFNSSRTVAGICGVFLLRGLGFLLRLFGNVFKFSGKMLVDGYDLLIFVPLWVERSIKARGDGHRDAGDMPIMREA